jgi:hypothetical protein
MPERFLRKEKERRKKEVEDANIAIGGFDRLSKDEKHNHVERDTVDVIRVQRSYV